MSGFAYFTGEKWVENLTMNDIRALAMTGVITETTLIRNPDGQEKEAKFYGLVFSKTPPQAKYDLQTDDESIMTPAISIIENMYRVAIVGVVLSGLAVTGVFGPLVSSTVFIVLILCLLAAPFFATFKYLVMGFDSMERTFRKIEKTMRKEDK